MKKMNLIVAIAIFAMVSSACAGAESAPPAEIPAAAFTAAAATYQAAQQPAAATPNWAATGQAFGGFVSPLPGAAETFAAALTPTALGTCGRSEDEINYGAYAPCATFSADTFVTLMTGGAPLNQGESALLPVYPQIRSLDRAFEANIDIGYQFRVGTSFLIPAAPANTRVLWLSTSWAEPSPPAWMNRLSCDGTDPCVVLVNSADAVIVNWSGRGLVLNRPLTAKEIAAITAFSKK